MVPQSISDLFAMGVIPFLSQAYLTGPILWTPEQMPDQSGRTIIITGGNSGVGKECAKALLFRNANVYLACRNQQKAEEAIKELRELTGKEAQFLRLDLANLKSVRTAADEFTRKEKQLHVLFNNGGVMFCSMDEDTNGYDTQIHTNVLGHFYFTQLLLPLLLATAEASPVELKPRIITVSSSGHYLAPANPLDFNTFKSGPARKKRTTEDMYIQSKFANVVFSNELARRYGDQGLVSTAVNPGNLKTGLNRHVKNPFMKLVLACLQFYPAITGAITQLWAATAPEGAGLNGKFLIPWARVGAPRSETQDPALGKDLWEWMEEQVREI